MRTYNNEHKHGTDTALQHAQEEAQCVDTLVVVADGGQDQSETPEHHGAGSHALNRVPLSQNHARVGANDEAEIEDGRNHGVPVVREQVQTLAETKEGLLFYPKVALTNPSHLHRP